jgi:DNA-binding GntR family transcriptional regulator
VSRGPERPYEIVAADPRRRIAAGEWQPGEALPVVAVLADHYQVSVVPRWATFRA